MSWQPERAFIHVWACVRACVRACVCVSVCVWGGGPAVQGLPAVQQGRNTTGDVLRTLKNESDSQGLCGLPCMLSVGTLWKL